MGADTVQPDISTHALTEGDNIHVLSVAHCIISTHALTEGDMKAPRSSISTRVFQLTPSRRATTRLRKRSSNPIYFNSRPHGGRLPKGLYISDDLNFNSRPHGGRPPRDSLPAPENHHFNSRPHGGRQYRCGGQGDHEKFQLTPSRRATANLDKFFF